METAALVDAPPRSHRLDRGTGSQFPQSGFLYLIPKSLFFNSRRRS